MKDELDRISLAERYAEAFNSSSWDSVVYLEEKIMKMWEKDLLNVRCDESIEKYAVKSLILKGRREGLTAVWMERERLLKDLKAHEDKIKEQDQKERRNNA